MLPNLLSDARDTAGNIIFPMLGEAEKGEIRLHDLAVIRDPYVMLGIVVVVMFVIMMGQGTGTEVNPKSWTQLKGSHGTQFRREISSD